MYRLNGLSLRRGTLPILALLCGLVVTSKASAGSDTSNEPAVEYVPYLSLGMGVIRSADTRFVDGDDAGHAALYGSDDRFDAGAVDNGPQVHLAAGVRTPSGVRVQLEVGLARSLDYRGNTNYRNSGTRQPAGADLNVCQLFLSGVYDFPGWELAPGRALRPFVGVGVGLTGYRLTGYVQRFPDPDDPNGYLRRGPGGEAPFTALPEGRGRNLSAMLTAGIAIPIRERVHLDLTYRYGDAGEISTAVGDIAIVRYRENGTKREIQVPINETSAELRTHTLLAKFRFGF
ncbi:MAG: outer membrane beta-barrel protein [Gammaproteobacteria bacterium]|nr:outer membrane beta-barrel protein [Gammaproteobacteria bacterium]